MDTRVRRHRVLSVLLISAAAWTIVFPAPVDATNFGSTSCGGTPVNCVSLANSWAHYVYFSNVRSDIKNATIWSLDNNYSPTDVEAVETSSSTDNDVSVHSYTYGQNGVFGWVNCPSDAVTSGSHPNRTCKGQVLKFNETYAYGFDTVDERRFQACHEMGHTLGLRHPEGDGDTCLRQGNLSITHLRPHDRDELNATY